MHTLLYGTLLIISGTRRRLNQEPFQDGNEPLDGVHPLPSLPSTLLLLVHSPLRCKCHFSLVQQWIHSSSHYHLVHGRSESGTINRVFFREERKWCSIQRERERESFWRVSTQVTRIQLGEQTHEKRWSFVPRNEDENLLRGRTRFVLPFLEGRELIGHGSRI